MVLIGSPGYTAISEGKLPMRATGVKSLIGSYGTVLNSAGAAEWVELVVINSVYPSAAACATADAAIKPPAPVLFSITNGCPRASCRCNATRRAAASVTLPGPNGTTTVTVLA